MKKIIVSLICALLICSVLMSCEKDPDEAIKDPNKQENNMPDAKTDNPDNRFGDVVIPKN